MHMVHCRAHVWVAENLLHRNHSIQAQDSRSECSGLLCVLHNVASRQWLQQDAAEVEAEDNM